MGGVGMIFSHETFELNEAIWTLIGVIVGGLITGVLNYFSQRAQFNHNIEMFQLQNKSRENVKEILEDLLNHRSFTDRSFKTLYNRTGGYTKDEVRQLLHEIGAKKVIRESDEWWYLKSREEERNNKKNDR